MTKVHKAVQESVIEVMGVKMRCYVTAEGKRIINCDDVHEFFRVMEDKDEITPEDAMKIAQLVKDAKVMTEVPEQND